MPSPIRELREALGKMTPGKWEYRERIRWEDPYDCGGIATDAPSEPVIWLGNSEEFYPTQGAADPDDLRGTATLRNLTPDLLDKVERLIAAVERAGVDDAELIEAVRALQETS